MITAATPSTSSSAGRVALAGILALALTLLARADSVKMPNGETLQGTIVQETADYVVFRSVSFGEIKIARAPGMEVNRASAVADAGRPPGPAAAPAAVEGPGGPGGQPPPPSRIRTALGLSDRWSAELEANMLFQNDTYHMFVRGTELTIGYKVPNESKPAQPRHEYGFFGSYNFQKVNDIVIGENAEVAFRYFYQPISPWLFVSQADWTRDRVNGIDSRAHVMAIPAYRLIDTPATRFLIGVGPSWLADSLVIATSPVASFLHRESGFRLALYELFQHKFTPAFTFRQTLVVLARPKGLGDTYNLRFGASLRRMLTPHLSLSLSYDYVRYETDYVLPPGAQGPSEMIGTTKLMFGYSL